MKAFQKVGPQLPEFSYPFIPRGKTPTCLNSSSHHVVSRRFFINSFNLPIVPLKRGPIRWSGFCRHSSVTPPVISQHLFSVLSLYDDVLGTSCIDPLSVFSYFSAELTMYGWLCEQRGREFYIGAIAFFFFFWLAYASCSIQLRLEIWFAMTWSDLLPHHLHEMWRKNLWDWSMGMYLEFSGGHS